MLIKFLRSFLFLALKKNLYVSIELIIRKCRRREHCAKVLDCRALHLQVFDIERLRALLNLISDHVLKR